MWRYKYSESLRFSVLVLPFRFKLIKVKRHKLSRLRNTRLGPTWAYAYLGTTIIAVLNAFEWIIELKIMRIESQVSIWRWQSGFLVLWCNWISIFMIRMMESSIGLLFGDSIYQIIGTIGQLCEIYEDICSLWMSTECVQHSIHCQLVCTWNIISILLCRLVDVITPLLKMLHK